MTSILMGLAVELERKLGLSRSQAISIAHSRLIELREEQLPSDHSIVGKLDDTTARNDLVQFLDRLLSKRALWRTGNCSFCRWNAVLPIRMGLHQHASPHGLPPSDRNVALRPLRAGCLYD